MWSQCDHCPSEVHFHSDHHRERLGVVCSDQTSPLVTCDDLYLPYHGSRLKLEMKSARQSKTKQSTSISRISRELSFVTDCETPAEQRHQSQDDYHVPVAAEQRPGFSSSMNSLPLAQNTLGYSINLGLRIKPKKQQPWNLWDPIVSDVAANSIVAVVFWVGIPSNKVSKAKDMDSPNEIRSAFL